MNKADSIIKQVMSNTIYSWQRDRIEAIWHFGPAHIVVEDGNYDDSALDFCMAEIKKLYQEHTFDLPCFKDEYMELHDIYLTLAYIYRTLFIMRKHLTEEQRYEEY